MPSPKTYPSETPSSPTPRKLLIWLLGACGFFVLLDVVFLVTGFDKHPYLKWEQWPGFYAVFGFVACVLLVLVSRFILRPLVRRDEDYYEKTSPARPRRKI